jgi:3-methyladenine DNA glycosylase/8-oxoguanine DNA glycosylase
VVETKEGTLIPVEVNPDSPDETRVLHVKVFHDAGTDEERLVEDVVRSVFCTDFALRRNHHVFHNGFGNVFVRYCGLKPHLSQDPYQSLAKIIIRQLIGAEQAKRMITTVTMKFGEKVSVNGFEFYAFPTAERLAKASKGELLSVGLGYKWRFVKYLSSEVAAGDLDLSRLVRLSDDRVIEELEERTGIGLWSSRVFLFDGLHRLDTYPISDITIRRALVSLWGNNVQGGDEIPDDWSVFGPQNYVGFYATYLFAYFREMVRTNSETKKQGQVHCS